MTDAPVLYAFPRRPLALAGSERDPKDRPVVLRSDLNELALTEEERGAIFAVARG